MAQTQNHQLLPLSQAQSPFFLGVDVGGTNIKLGLVDDQGQTLARETIATREERGPDDAVRRMAEAGRRLAVEVGLTLEGVATVGLAMPGTMDLTTGRTVSPHNLPHWWEFPIRDRLGQECGRPVTFANDAGAAAFGEYWVGSGKAYHSLILLTLGTGLGGGIIIGDLSIDGEHSHGAECGHILLDYHDEARRCGCGKRGCLEAYVSAVALVSRTTEALDAGRESSLRECLESGQKLTPLVIAQEAEAGDGLAEQMVLDTAMYLGIGAVSLAHTIDPGAIILGGAMNFGGHASKLGRAFLERVREEFRRRAFPVLATRTAIDFASLGSDAGYIGAAGIARAAYLVREKS